MKFVTNNGAIFMPGAANWIQFNTQEEKTQINISKEFILKLSECITITQNRVMNFVYRRYEFFVSTVSFSVNGPSLCCEKQKKIETRP